MRYPPSVSQGRVFVGSGDGYAYALEAATGKLLWRFRAAPAERKILVYGSIQSTWPVATGVLVANNVAYFAAGMNNYDGTHDYAVDAESGAIKWQNNDVGGTGASVGVQGDLLLNEDKLYLAGGNAASPAVFDIIDGRCLDKGSKNRSGRELRLSAAKNKDGEIVKKTDLNFFDRFLFRRRHKKPISITGVPAIISAILIILWCVTWFMQCNNKYIFDP